MGSADVTDTALHALADSINAVLRWVGLLMTG